MSGFSKFLASLGLIVVLLAAGGGVAALLYRTRPQPPESSLDLPAQLVETIELTPADRVERIIGYGTAHADQVAVCTAEVSASVVELPGDLEVGTPVQKGQVLVRLDEREYQEQLQRAQQLAQADRAEIERLHIERASLEKIAAIAQVKVAITESEKQRVEKLYQEANAAESEFNRVCVAYQDALQNLQTLQNQRALIEPGVMRLQASLAARLNEAAIAELNVERCRITAPFSGQIDATMVEVGDSVRPGSAMLRLMSLGRIEVPIELGVSLRDHVSVGAECVLGVDSAPDVRWQGVVSRLSPSADERSRTFAVYVEVDNHRQDTRLIPGCFVRAEITGPLLRSVLVLPRSAIVRGQVFVMENEAARARSIHVECFLEDQAVVTGDVKPGDRVITSNLDVLHAGVPVRLK